MIQILRKKVSIVRQAFEIIAHTMCINFINMKEEKKVIDQICTKNTISILGLEIKWIDWLSNPALEKKEFLLVIECKTAIKANGAIEKDLAISAELDRCFLYNLACKQK